MKNVVSIGLYLFFASLHFHKIEIYPTTAELKEGSNHGFYLRHLHHLYLYLYQYVEDTTCWFNSTGERAEHLLSVLESCFEALNCLCMHYLFVHLFFLMFFLILIYPLHPTPVYPRLQRVYFTISRQCIIIF